MKKLELKEYTIQTLKMFLRTVKPWKINETGLYEFDSDKHIRRVHYAEGWNDCVKEMKKNGDKFIKHIGKL